MKKTRTILSFFLLFLFPMLFHVSVAHARDGKNIIVETVDFLKNAGLSVNGAGPIIVKVDSVRNRIIAANTLSSSLSVIDGKTHTVENIPLGGRALQHLKEEAMFISAKTGTVYLIGARCFSVIYPEKREALTIPTDIQFESVTVNEKTGNAFLAGRESMSLGFLKGGSSKIEMIEWLESKEDLLNLNQTPPPSIRKVVSDDSLNRIIAVDGYTSMLFLFDVATGEQLQSRKLGLTSGGRWHLAGYDQEDHHLYLVTETDRREIIEAGRIDVSGGNDMIVQLPKFTEGVGIRYNQKRKEVYIPYDNHASVHVVDFRDGGVVDEIKIPAYGNDASALNEKNDILYIGSWAHGEVDVIDLEKRRLHKRILDLGIIPHMFSIAFNPNSNLVYFPKGATAVNGAFGAAISALDPLSGKVEKIFTGWSPIDLIESRKRGSFLVFNSEDQFAEVRAGGTFDLHDLPYDYPIRAVNSPEGNIYLSYGPHQSYWPVVYIWDAKNGILTIDEKDLSIYDRRIPRQAHAMELDERGVLYFTQNNWGKEEQFLGVLKDEIRLYDPGDRIALEDEVEREITQRLLEYDPVQKRLFLVRVAEKDDDPSLLQIIDPVGKKVLIKIPLGLTASDLLSDDENLSIANFDSDTVSIVNKKSFETIDLKADAKPLRLCRLGNTVYVVTHRGNTLQEVTGDPKEKKIEKTFRIPFEGLPDNLFVWKEKVIITSHSSAKLFIIGFDPAKESFSLLHTLEYPYADTSFDSRNVSFYVRGQFGDAVFSITNGKEDSEGRLWVTDFLSGKLFILSESQ